MSQKVSSAKRKFFPASRMTPEEIMRSRESINDLYGVSTGRLRSLRNSFQAANPGELDEFLLKDAPLGKEALSKERIDRLGDERPDRGGTQNEALLSRWNSLSPSQRIALLLDAYLRRQEHQQLADQLSSRPRWPFAKMPSLVAAALIVLILAAAFRSFGVNHQTIQIIAGPKDRAQPEQGSDTPSPPVSQHASGYLWALTFAILGVGLVVVWRTRSPTGAAAALGIAAFTGMIARDPKFLENIIGKVSISIDHILSLSAGGGGYKLDAIEECEVGPFASGFYDLRKDEPMRSATQCLNELRAKSIRPSMLLIVGQTDKSDLLPSLRKTYGTNSALAYRRASTVKEFLAENGIQAQTLLLSTGPFTLDKDDKEGMAKDRSVRVVSYTNVPVTTGAANSTFTNGLAFFFTGLAAGLLSCWAWLQNHSKKSHLEESERNPE